MSDITPNYDESIAFLRLMHPGRRWALTAIHPEKKDEVLPTDTFDETRIDACLRWLRTFGEEHNLYFSVAEVARDVKKKASRSDIARVWHLHVDIDPRAGEDLDAEQARALAIVKAPPGLPPPTCITFSGGGYQAFWSLREPIAIDCDVERAEQAKLFNLAIELATGADRCHNVDRVMRLPGTVNLPDAGKKAKGRKEALAKLVEHSPERVYDIAQFSPARPLAAKAGSAATAKLSASPTPKRINEVNDLPATVSDRAKMVIVYGIDLHDPDKFGTPPDRSKWLFYAVNEMVRGGCDNDTIYGVITDERFAISASVRDKGRDSRRTAERQIARARGELAAERAGKAGGPLSLDFGDAKPGPRDLARSLLKHRGEPLIHLNGEYHTWRGGAYRSREEDTLRRESYDFLEAVRQTPNQRLVSTVLDSVRSLTHLDRADYSAPCWTDGRAGPDPANLLVCRNGLLHLPTGELRQHDPAFLTHNRLDYDYDPAAPAPERWLKFLRDLWPGEDADCIEALQQWFGYLLAPDTSQQKILVLVGPKRSGKGTIARVLTSILGQHNVCSPQLSQFGEQFGRQSLIGKQVAILSDMRLGGRADKAAIAETLLTVSGEDNVSIPRKNVRDWEGRLRTRFVVMSNETPSIPDPSGALPGRYIVLEMQQSFYGREDSGLTDKLMAERSGILNWAIAGWHKLRAAGRLTQPESGRAMVEEIERSSSEVGTFVADRCELVPGAVESKDVLYREFCAWAAEEGMTHVPKKAQFCKDVLSAYRGTIKPAKPRDGGERRPSLAGIKLLPGPF